MASRSTIGRATPSWITWTATLTQNRDDFAALVAPVFRFMNETPDRSPLTDWYETTNARKVRFTARPVIGGVFLQMLYDHDVWRKYASGDTTKASGWAPMPSRDAHDVTEIVPTARKAPVVWRYTLDKPADNWMSPDFDDSAWKEAPAGFGTAGTPNAVVRTEWKGKAIWLRRACELEDPKPANPRLIAYFDEDATVYLNGIVAAELPGWTDNYEQVPIEPPAIAALRGGRNVLAVHCQQTFGGQYIDVGITVEAAKAVQGDTAVDPEFRAP